MDTKTGAFAIKAHESFQELCRDIVCVHELVNVPLLSKNLSVSILFILLSMFSGGIGKNKFSSRQKMLRGFYDFNFQDYWSIS